MYAAVQASRVEMSMMEERRVNEERFTRETPRMQAGCGVVSMMGGSEARCLDFEQEGCKQELLQGEAMATRCSASKSSGCACWWLLTTGNSSS